MDKLVKKITEDVINKIKILQESKESNDYKIIIIDDKQEIKKYINDIWNIMCVSYEDKGGFSTAQSPNHLLKMIDRVKLVFNENTIIACATHRISGGYKMNTIGCIQNSDGKKALREIIKDDIKNFKEWYWVEVSEAVEHYLKKYEGYPIPNIYASLILQKDVELMEDDIHYKRNVGVDNIPYIKAIYGFKDENLYNKVLEEIDNYDDFRKRINSIKESLNNYTDDINKALMIIENIYVYHIEDRFNEMPPYWYKCIKWAIKILNETTNKDKNINKYIQMGFDLIDEMPLITINKINF